MFRNPVHCVKIAKDGLVYVCDRVNNRMQVFRKDGTFVREWIFLKETLGSGAVWDMYFWPDRDQTFFINVDGANNEFRVVRRADGEVLATYGRYGRNGGAVLRRAQRRHRLARQCLHHGSLRGQAYPEMEGREWSAAAVRWRSSIAVTPIESVGFDAVRFRQCGPFSALLGDDRRELGRRRAPSQKTEIGQALADLRLAQRATDVG